MYLKETVAKSIAPAKGTIQNTKIAKLSFSTLVYEGRLLALSKALPAYKKTLKSELVGKKLILVDILIT